MSLETYKQLIVWQKLEKMLFVLIKNLTAKRSILPPKPNTLYPKNGFTLIETLIYTAIVSLMVISLVSFALTVGGSRDKARAIAEVQENGRVATEVLGRYIRNATSVTAPAVGGSGSVLTLTMTSPQNPVTFSVDGGALVLAQTGSATTTITGNLVSITNFVVTITTSTGARRNVRYNFTSQFAANSDAHNSYSQSFSSAVSTRQ